MPKEIQNIIDEADEVSTTFGPWKEMENQIITIDQGREYILKTNPTWSDGGESIQLIDNVSESFVRDHNNAVTERAEMELRQSLLQPRSIKEIPLPVRDAMDAYSIDAKQMLKMHPKEMFKCYMTMLGKGTTAEEIYDIAVKLSKMEGR